MFKIFLVPLIFLSATSSYAVCTAWISSKVGQLDPTIIDEASGLVSSSIEKNMLIWSNDSGNRAELFATGKDGRVTRTVRLNGISNRDLEAMAIGPCPSNQADSCMFVGDIGDGIGWRSNFEVSIFREDDFWSKTALSPIKVINYSARNTNAESMIVSPEGKIIIFTKDDSGVANIIVIDSVSGRASSAGQLDLNFLIKGVRGKGPRITDASLSPDGTNVLLLTYGDIIEINMETLNRTLSVNTWRKGIDYNVIKGPEFPQQETLTYLRDGKAFIVSTESPNGEIPSIYQYICKE